MHYITHFTAHFTAHGGTMPHHDRTSSPGGAVHDAGSDLAPDTGNGANRYPDRFTYAEPGADFLADVAAHSDGDHDATAHRARIAAALAHPHERPRTHAGSGDHAPLRFVDSDDPAWHRALGRAVDAYDADRERCIGDYTD